MPSTKAGRTWNSLNATSLNLQLYYGQDDDIIAWLQTLPEGKKHATVRSILRAHIEQETRKKLAQGLKDTKRDKLTAAD